MLISQFPLPKLRILLVLVLGVCLSGCGVSQRLFEVFKASARTVEVRTQPTESSKDLEQVAHRFASFRYTIVPERLHLTTVSKIKKWAVQKINKAKGKPKQDVEVAKVKPLPKVEMVVRSSDQLHFCRQVDHRLSSVTFKNCLNPIYKDTGFKSVGGKPLT